MVLILTRDSPGWPGPRVLIPHCHSEALQAENPGRDMDLLKLGNTVTYLTSSRVMDVNGFNLLLLQIVLQWAVQTILCECVSAFVVQTSGTFLAGLKNIEQIFEERWFSVGSQS